MGTKYRALKYMGEDLHSWAVFIAKDLEKGARSPYCGPAMPVVSGLSLTEAAYYKKWLEENRRKIMSAAVESRHNLLRLNRKLRGTGYQVYGTRTRFRVQNGKGHFLFYAKSVRAALNRAFPNKRKTEIDELVEHSKYLELTDELKKKLVERAKKEWNEIAYDYIRVSDDGMNTGTECSGEEAREGVADRLYGYVPEWEEISFEDHDVVLKEALPLEKYCL